MRILTLSILLATTILSMVLPEQPGKLQKELMDVLNAESHAFYTRDFSGWQESYIHFENMDWVCVEEDGLVLEAHSWNELNKLVGSYMESNPESVSVEIKRENVRIIPGNNQVWISFDEYQTTQGKTKHLKGVRLMTKVGKTWKIAAMQSSFVRYL